MIRDDLSTDLVHFVKGETFEDGFCVLRQILTSKCLFGGAGFVRGGHSCVCFSEAPITHLGSALMRPGRSGLRYQPFGVLLRKSWIFALGGRPVIYQPESEYGLLPRELQWRHVRYEPNGDPPIDFTWEREWRIPTDRLLISPADAQVVLPSQSWLQSLKRKHDSDQQHYAYHYQSILGEAAWALVEAFPWASEVLDRLEDFR